MIRLLLGRSIQGRLAALLLLVGVGPLVAMAVYFATSQRAVLSDTADQNLRSHAQLEAGAIGRLLRDARAHVQVLADSPVLQSASASSDEMLAQLGQAQRFSPLLEDISLVDTEGNVVASTSYAFRGTWQGKQWFEDALAGNPSQSDAHFIPSPTRLVVVFTAPVVAESGVKYVVAGQMNLEPVWDILDSQQIGETGYLTVVDRFGGFVSHPNKDLILTSIPESAWSEGNESGGRLRFQSPDGSGELVGEAAEVGELGWKVLALQDPKEAYALSDDALQKIGLAALFVLVGTALASVILSRMLGRPIRALASSMERIASGHLSERVSTRAPAELGDLARSFNVMAAGLEQSRRELQAAQDELQQRYDELKDAHDNLSSLHLASSELLVGLRATRSWRAVPRVAVERLGADLAIVCEVDDRRQSPIVRDWWPAKTELKGGLALKRGKGLADCLALAQPAAAVGATVESQAGCGGDEAAKAPAESLRRALVALDFADVELLPLVWSGDTLGLLILARRDAKFSEHDREVHSIFANQTAAAIRNASLFEHVQRLADSDPLTGLFNHRRFHEMLASVMKERREAKKWLSLLMADLDNFKQFNDTYGHPAGDDVLRLVAECVKSSVRAGDVVARYGGDELVIILPGSDEKDALRVARRIQGEVSKLRILSNANLPLPLGMSIGIASAPQDAREPGLLVAAADAALLEAKHGGGGRIQLANATPTERLVTVGRSGATFQSIITAIGNRDEYTRYHSDLATVVALKLADELGLTSDLRRTLELAGPLHDVGKIAVPDSILRKPGVLEPQEWETIRQHPVIGAKMLAEVPELVPDVLDVVRHHHEWFDGSGYAAGLRGEEIPFLARLFSVADAYSAMTTDRPYRRALTASEAKAKVEAGLATQFDVEIGRAFLALLEQLIKRWGEQGLNARLLEEVYASHAMASASALPDSGLWAPSSGFPAMEDTGWAQ
ncbi:MAG: diguanylate cyclase [Dehalococcoidia bacterium]